MMADAQTKKIYWSLGMASAFTLLAAQRYGLGLAVFALPLVIWIPYSLGVAVFKPSLRKTQLIRVAIWVASIVAVLCIHYIRHEMVRRDANEIVASIKVYAAKAGHYPRSLEETGLDRQAMKDKLGISYYSSEDGPALAYGATYTVFDVYQYDFKKGEWILRHD